MLGWILFLAIVLLVAYWLPAFRRFKLRYDFAQTIPGPSVIDFIRASRKGNTLEFLTECRKKYGPLFRVWHGFDLLVHICDPEDIRTIVLSNDVVDKSDGYRPLEAWLGKGLLTSAGENWHLKRKLLTPAFHFQLLSSFQDPMGKHCDILIQKLNEVADGRPVDIYRFITLFALDVICETAMGVKMNAQYNETSDYVQMTKLICHLVQRQAFSVWKRNEFLYRWSSEKKKRDEALVILHGETKRVIRMKRDQLMEKQDRNKDAKETVLGAKKRRAFLDSLLISQRETGMLTDENIQEETDTFMFEGHDTTSSAIAFTLFLLGKHPEVQQRLLEEILNTNDDDDLHTMPYLEAVIKESMRLLPSATAFGRQSKQPFTIGKHIIPPSVVMQVDIYIVQRDAEYFTDPLAFRPERFLKDAAPINRFAYIPFSAGIRNCIGQRYAMLELKVSLRRLVRALEFKEVPGFQLQLKPEVVTKSANGVYLRILKRDQAHY